MIIFEIPNTILVEKLNPRSLKIELLPHPYGIFQPIIRIFSLDHPQLKSEITDCFQDFMVFDDYKEKIFDLLGI